MYTEIFECATRPGYTTTTFFLTAAEIFWHLSSAVATLASSLVNQLSRLRKKKWGMIFGEQIELHNKLKYF